MAFNVPLAIRCTPYYAKTVGWKDNLAQVCAVLGFKANYPTARDFVFAVSRWQDANVLDPDGMLGPMTWKKMKPLVDSYSGEATMMGPHPKWVYVIDPNANIPNLPQRHDTGPKLSLSSNEDRVLKEMAAVAVQQRANPFVAVPVSAPYIGMNGYPAGVKSVSTSGAISGALQVGQEWKGLEGKRLIAGLSGAGYLVQVPSGGWGYGGTVLFVTESGQGYEQRLEGWESDIQARMWAETALRLKSLQKMLDVEVAFLNGAQAAWNFPLYAAVHAGAFYLTHKDKIGTYIEIAGTILAIRSLLKRVAPNLYSKVFNAVLKRIWSSLWDNLADNITAENLAKFIGMVIVSRGKAFYADLCRESASVLKLIVIKLVRCVEALVDAGMLLARATPNAAKNAARDEAKTILDDTIAVFRKLGVELTEADLSLIAEEFKANQPAIMAKVQELEENLKGL